MNRFFWHVMLLLLVISVPVPAFCEEPGNLPEKIKYIELAKQMLMQGNAQGALIAGWKIRELDPKDEIGYRFIVVALMKAQRYQEIPGEVFMAQGHGVRSLFLYQRQAEALFLMGGFSAGLYSFQETELFLSGKPPSKRGI